MWNWEVPWAHLPHVGPLLCHIDLHGQSSVELKKCNNCRRIRGKLISGLVTSWEFPQPSAICSSHIPSSGTRAQCREEQAVQHGASLLSLGIHPLLNLFLPLPLHCFTWLDTKFPATLQLLTGWCRCVSATHISVSYSGTCPEAVHSDFTVERFGLECRSVVSTLLNSGWLHSCAALKEIEVLLEELTPHQEVHGTLTWLSCCKIIEPESVLISSYSHLQMKTQSP